MDGVECFHERSFGRGEDVPVQVQRRGDGGVAEAFLDELGVSAGGDEQAGAGVP